MNFNPTRWLVSIVSFVLIIICIPNALADTNNENAPEIGNFALPSSQQPGAFFSFGQNTLEKGKTQLFLFADDYVGNHQHAIDAVPGIVYGISDNLSIFLNVPIAVNYQQASNHSSGIRDALLQLEYAFYSKQTSRYSDTATLVANVSAPTGSSDKNPPTGYGAPSFFIGGTYSRLYADWFGFVSPGILAPTAHNGTQFGNNYLYQFGLGKNISYATSKYIFSWLIELNGNYTEKNRINGVQDPNSGGNVIYAIPSLWFSTTHAIIQAGIGWAISQHWNGNQPKDTYVLGLNLGWTFS